MLAPMYLGYNRGMQAAGDTHLQTAHWQHDYLTADQTDFAPFITAYGAYSHGRYGTPPVLGQTYAESRALYGQSIVRPTWLLETNYWGSYGATRAQIRYFHWAAALSTIGGVTFGFNPLWFFATSADGTTRASGSGGITTAWIPSTTYNLNEYASKGGNWYRATTGGRSGSAGPSGTGSGIADGTVTWAYAGTGNWSSLLNEPGVLDFQQMGSILDGLPRHQLIPSGLGGLQTLVTAGTGTYATWSDHNFETGGMDWVTSAAAPDGTLLVAYVPDGHTGPLTVAMSALSGAVRARWYDPASGNYVDDSAGAGYPLSNAGTHAFTVLGVNSAGASDWALMLDIASIRDH